MSDNSLVLSILIPTYNRAEAIDECLAQFLKEDSVVHGDEIEIVVSDNASTDNTEAICHEYERKFNGKLRYFRQKENIGASNNFTFLLKNGRGKFFKFNADKNVILPGTMAKVLEFVKKHMDEKPVICFGNEHLTTVPLGVHIMHTHDALADTVSYWTTWIDTYGVWKDDVGVVIPIQDEYAPSLLQQVAVTWKLFDKKRIGYCYNYAQYGKLHARVWSACGYNTVEVFSKNYLSIIKENLGEGRLSRAAFEREKKRLWFGHVFGMYFDFEHILGFDRGHFFEYTRDFWFEWYYWGSLLAVPLFYAVGRMPLSARVKFFNFIRTVRKLIAKV